MHTDAIANFDSQEIYGSPDGSESSAILAATGSIRKTIKDDIPVNNPKTKKKIVAVIDEIFFIVKVIYPLSAPPRLFYLTTSPNAPLSA